MILLKPYLGCNMKCPYCYEQDIRGPITDALDATYDIKKMFQTLKQIKNPREICLHGGEPLCMPKKDVEEILKRIYKISERSAIQTNGLMIDDDYIKMFHKYKTSVGISFDGPGELSYGRTRHPEIVEANIDKLKENKINVNLLIVINKCNGTGKNLGKLKEWLIQLDKKGINNGRINVCTGSKYELTSRELTKAFLDLAPFMMANNFNWTPFSDIKNKVLGKSAVCTFEKCDPYHTPSAEVILGDGTITNCMRLNKTEILIQHPIRKDIRQQILSEIPMEQYGCKDCKWFSLCTGGCPGSAINDDWRNKTRHCETWYMLFDYFSNVVNFIGRPVEGERTSPKKPEDKGDPNNRNASRQEAEKAAKRGEHGDWLDTNPPKENVSWEEAEEAIKRGEHGDWTDRSRC
jgi:uncharacterized protein